MTLANFIEFGTKAPSDLALRPYGCALTVVAVVMQGHLAVTASDEGMAKVWDVGSGQLMHVLEGNCDWGRAVALALHNNIVQV